MFRHISFSNYFHYRLLQGVGYSSLCHAADPCLFCVLQCVPANPHSSSTPPPSPLVTLSLFFSASESVSVLRTSPCVSFFSRLHLGATAQGACLWLACFMWCGRPQVPPRRCRWRHSLLFNG